MPKRPRTRRPQGDYREKLQTDFGRLNPNKRVDRHEFVLLDDDRKGYTYYLDAKQSTPSEIVGGSEARLCAHSTDIPRNAENATRRGRLLVGMICFLSQVYVSYYTPKNTLARRQRIFYNACTRAAYMYVYM